MMKETLVIGSTVVDVLLYIPNIPLRSEDINISAAEHRIGGCAYNVYKALKSQKSPAVLCSPIGGGIYGRIVEEHFAAQSINPIAVLEKENGCCYCLVEPAGERTFLSLHGLEYSFSRKWLKNLDFSKIDSVYICGLEIEESTGTEIIEFIDEHHDL
jgi:sugar/nucleoside kinase (ribokinase family)